MQLNNSCVLDRLLTLVCCSFSLSARLPDSGGAHHLDEARREGAGKLKDTRRRLERQPRLEQAGDSAGHACAPQH